MQENYEKKIKKIAFNIKGMSCVSCETRIENSLKKLDGIISVKVDYSKQKAIVAFYEDEINEQTIAAKIKDAGYEIINDKKNFSLIQLAGIAVIIFVVFFVLNKTGVFNLLPAVNNSMGYGILFVVGLLTSIHCIAMCGGINLSQSVKQNNDDSNRQNYKKFVPGALYNAGRVVSYTFVGGIVGTIGSVINFSGKLQGVIIIAAGIFMILMSLNLMGLFPWLSKITPRIPKFITKPLSGLKSGNKSPFIVGLLNGLMPCGPLQSMQLYALSTGSFFHGVISMFIFSLGTVPLMMGISFLSTLFNNKFAGRMLKISALLILFLGLGMIGRGFNLSGLDISGVIPKNQVAVNKPKNTAVIQNGIQYVESGITAKSFEPITVQKGIPVKWTIKADDSSLNGCNNAIYIPDFNIRKNLGAGNNEIEFTPVNSGSITFTCWMGMITSSIKVVDDINNVSESQTIINKAGNDDSKQSKPENIATINSGIQYVKSGITSSSYEPIIVQKGIPVRWTIKADSSSLTNCNETIKIPQYNITKKLIAGDNLIEFVPDKTGIVEFTCWMGMIASSIKVVDNINNATNSDLAELKNNSRSSNGNGGCCSQNNSQTASNFYKNNFIVKNENIGKSDIINGVQYAKINIDEKGYSPGIIVMQKGIKTKWIINLTDGNEKNYRMVVPVYNAKIELKKGENSIDFVPEVDFNFDSWQNDYHGYIAVVDNINSYTADEIKNKIANYKPVNFSGNTGGGCCGR